MVNFKFKIQEQNLAKLISCKNEVNQLKSTVEVAQNILEEVIKVEEDTSQENEKPHVRLTFIFYQKMFYDKMHLCFFYFHVMIYWK